MCIDAATDGEVFQAYVANVLVPSLRQGDIVVLDNLGAHKSAAVEAAIRSAGATAEYLPAYSPDLNPIEKMWSKIKRSCGPPGRGRQGLSTRRSGKHSVLSRPMTPWLGWSRAAIDLI